MTLRQLNKLAGMVDEFSNADDEEKERQEQAREEMKAMPKHERLEHKRELKQEEEVHKQRPAEEV